MNLGEFGGVLFIFLLAIAALLLLAAWVSSAGGR